MPQLRKDPVLDRWVIVAAERGERPFSFDAPTSESEGGFCPFCPGNEDRTPKEVWAVRDEGSRPNGPGWEVRVVPNKYPALAIEGQLDRQGLGIYDMMNGVGAHEVIIESPDHDFELYDASEPHMLNILNAYQERITDLRRDDRMRFALVFRNFGERAGASLSHPHSQLIALAITPKNVKDKLTAAWQYYQEKERCVFCDIISQELRSGERVVAESDHFVALCPFAARFPYEVVIFAKEHCHDFCLMDEPLLADFGAMLQDTLQRVARALNCPPYNYVLHTAPNTVPRPGRPDFWGTLPLDYHWHVELLPRVTRTAGFEWGTGFYINPVAPEFAAERLRECGAERTLEAAADAAAIPDP
ncbi:MAG: galactose-1-phosphate uridylyltransferase [Armatimonadota bacterium]